MKTITVNGKTYPAKDFSYNTICSLEEMGVDIDHIKTTILLRAYIAICMGVSKEEAGIEIGNHVANGGDISEIANVINDKMAEETSFFRQTEQGAKKNAQKKGKKEA